MTFLHNPLTPDLIRATIPTAVLLIEKTTCPGSAQRFNHLCEMLGDSIIGSVWLYGSSEPDSIMATLEGLPVIMSELGIGVSRYLKVCVSPVGRKDELNHWQAIIPQLLHPLLISAENTPSSSFQLRSVRTLITLIEHCPERMPRWKTTILVGIARLWTTLGDSRLESHGRLA